MTHTTGLGYWFWSENLVRWEKVSGTPNVVAGSNDHGDLRLDLQQLPAFRHARGRETV
jgi:hypothetical protein